jgi:alpha-glucosidase
MTSRHLTDDLANAEVRGIIRRTMIEINPGHDPCSASRPTTLMGDFQGDAWHGAMTHANFTRPCGDGCSIQERESSYFGLLRHHPVLQRRSVFAAHRQFAYGFPWRVQLEHDERPGHPRHPCASSLTIEASQPGRRRRPAMTLPGIP